MISPDLACVVWNAKTEPVCFVGLDVGYMEYLCWNIFWNFIQK